MAIYLISTSPIYAALLSLGVYLYVRFKTQSAEAPSFFRFFVGVFGLAFLLGAIGFFLMFAYCLHINSGNCPLAAIFVTSPLGFSLGTVLGLIRWSYRVSKT